MVPSSTEDSKFVQGESYESRRCKRGGERKEGHCIITMNVRVQSIGNSNPGDARSGYE